MNSKMLIGIVIAALVLAGVIVASSSKKNVMTSEEPAVGEEKVMEKKVSEDESEATEDENTEEEAKDSEGAMKKTVKEVRVEGSPFKFTPNVIRVKRGDTVRVTFMNNEGFHDYLLDEFNVKTKQLQAGGQETVSFVADKTGTFEYYCSVGTHRAQGMVGSLIVQ